MTEPNGAQRALLDQLEGIQTGLKGLVTAVCDLPNQEIAEQAVSQSRVLNRLLAIVVVGVLLNLGLGALVFSQAENAKNSAEESKATADLIRGCLDPTHECGAKTAAAQAKFQTEFFSGFACVMSLPFPEPGQGRELDVVRKCFGLPSTQPGP